jgi:MATE family multidrug resistance protein
MGELWAISWPLVIASAANMFMVLADRVVVSKYSADAYHALAGATAWWWTIYCTMLNIALAADIFVGRYNGMQDHRKIGPAIWQMLWFALIIFPFFIVFSLWMAPHLLAKNLRELGVPYMRIILLIIPISVAATGALGSFFTGQGKTRAILLVATCCNIINILLDVLLVFGLGLFPEMGVTGAGIATAITQVIEFFMFALLIFRRKNGELYDIFNWKFYGKQFRECLRIGMPNAIDCLINGSLWSILIQVAAMQVSHEQFSIFCMCHSIFCTLFFFSEGIGQGVGIITSNAYGARNWQMIHSNMRSWIRITLLSAIIAFFVLIIYPSPLISLLRPSNAIISPTILSHMLFLMWACFIAESYAFNLRMSLTAFGDTRFTLAINCGCCAVFFIIPGYIGLYVCHNILTVGISWACCYTAFSAICFPRLRQKLEEKRAT